MEKYLCQSNVMTILFFFFLQKIIISNKLMLSNGIDMKDDEMI